MENKHTQQILVNANIADHYYIDSKTFYFNYYGTLPNVSMIYSIDNMKLAEEIKRAFADKIEEIFTHRTCVIIAMKETVAIELGANYAEVLYGDNITLVDELTAFILPFKLKRSMLNCDGFLVSSTL